MGDDAGEYLMLLGGELLIDYAALRLANALNDDLLCRLGGDTPELLRLHRDGQHIAELGAAAQLLCGFKVDLVRGIFDFLHDGLVDVHLDALVLLVKNDLNIVLAFGVVAAECRKHRLLDFVVHICSGDALFFFYILYCLEKFCVHF